MLALTADENELRRAVSCHLPCLVTRGPARLADTARSYASAFFQLLLFSGGNAVGLADCRLLQVPAGRASSGARASSWLLRVERRNSLNQLLALARREPPLRRVSWSCRVVVRRLTR